MGFRGTEKLTTRVSLDDVIRFDPKEEKNSGDEDEEGQDSLGCGVGTLWDSTWVGTTHATKILPHVIP